MTRTYVADETEDMQARWVGKSGGTFRIVDGPGPLPGDCEAFVTTMLWRVEGRSLVNFFAALLMGRAQIWRTYSVRGVKHAALWHRDHGWIDSTLIEWRAEPTYLTLRHKRWVTTVALKMLVEKLK